jgi:FMN phosphatase YigB (HAD superfamily)
MVGNSIEDDIIPAESIGMKGVLIDRENKYPDKESIKNLNELLDKFELIK